MAITCEQTQMIAIIPARAGSKGLPGKNVRLLAGLPLIAHTIKAAVESKVFSKVLVTSDDHQALKVAESLGVIPITRPAELALDDTTMAAVVNHILSLDVAIDASAFALLQPTSPLRNAQHIKECAKVFSFKDYRSVVSVCLLEHPPQKSLIIQGGGLQPLTSWSHLNQNRQSLEPAYRQNGAMWFVKCAAFLKEQRFVIAPAGAYVMDEDASIDIDTMRDFDRTEQILEMRAQI